MVSTTRSNVSGIVFKLHTNGMILVAFTKHWTCVRMMYPSLTKVEPFSQG